MLSMLNYITWDVSPFIYEGEHFAIGWYGTLWTLGLIGMLITLLATFRHDGVPTQYALITFMVSLICVIFFGHLFQGLFYEWYYSPDDPWYFLGIDWDYRNYYFDHPWKFFDFAHGGFASHGAIMGVYVAGGVLEKWMQINAFQVIDRGIMGLDIVGITVRLGNFFNSEIYGIQTVLPWGIVFEGQTVPAHPTMFYEILIFLIALLIGWWLYIYKDGGNYTGVISGFMLLCIMILRLLVEFIKLPQMSIEQGWILNMGQILSIPFILLMPLQIRKAIQRGVVNPNAFCDIKIIIKSKRKRK